MFVLVNIMIKNVFLVFIFVIVILYKIMKYVSKNNIFVCVNLKKIKNVIQTNMFVYVTEKITVFLIIIDVFVKIKNIKNVKKKFMIVFVI
jgi:hypothetical protein